MTKNSCTTISLDRRVTEYSDAPEWSGAPDADSGIFTISDRYVIRVLELSIAIWPESIVGPDKPILSMHYEASLVTGEEWALGGELYGMLPNGKWFFDGRDDLGTEYEYQQGASGFRDRGRTVFDSDISFEPDVPLTARWVEIRFMDWRSPHQPVHTFRADVLPLMMFGAGNR